MLTAPFRAGSFGLAFLFLGLTASSQQKTFRINPGLRIADVVPKEEIYTYPSFQDGIVYLKDNRALNARLNYNALYGDVEFIDPKGDTLALSDENPIRFIAIRSDTFYYDKIFLKQVAGIGKRKLAERQIFSSVNREKFAGYGESSVGSIDTYSRISAGGLSYNLVANEHLTIAKDKLFFVGDEFNHFFPATKKGLTELFSKNQKKLSGYLHDKSVDFSKEEDLRNLLLFMETDLPPTQ